MSTVVEIKNAIENLAPTERDNLTEWLLKSAKFKTETNGIHPDIAKMTGLVPKDLDATAEFHGHQIKKHQ